MVAQSQTLEDINIPESFQLSLNGEQFLIKDSTVGEERILLFTTKANIRNLSQALFWVINGTYKTVPNVFTSCILFMHPLVPKITPGFSR